MSLAKEIIYGTDKDVANFLRKHPKLNELDEYGYTPLVQAAIVNSPSKAKLLLERKASVDFPDLTGRTPLFWAADNDNAELCELLLSYNANPNAYSLGGQPILVLPVLKKLQNIKNILVNAGARIDFAQDFINAKLLGHSFELEGRIDIVDTKNTFIEVEFEGFFLRYTLEIITNSLMDFRNNFGGKKLRKYFAKLDLIISSLQVAIELIRMQSYLVDIKQNLTKINKLLDYQPLIIPVAFGGHAITLIKLWDWVIRCDRGAYGRQHGTVNYYEMRESSRFTKSLCRELLYKRQYPEFINIGLLEYLDLDKKWMLPVSAQKTGTCAWANVEAIIPAMMFLLLLEERGRKIKLCEEEAFDFYHEWQEWNKIRSLDFCLQSFNEASPARKAAKAAQMGAILFQACDYNKPEDQEKANKILNILTQPEYNHVLKSYIKVFSQDKNNQYLQNLYNFLDVFGVDITELERLV
jgi:ankyrin repeat protein